MKLKFDRQILTKGTNALKETRDLNKTGYIKLTINDTAHSDTLLLYTLVNVDDLFKKYYATELKIIKYAVIFS